MVSAHSHKMLTPEQKGEVLRLISEGKTITATCDQLQIKPWHINSAKKHSDEFERDLRHAREMGMSVRVESMADVAMDPNIGPQRARVWCDAVKFQAEREYRRIWGASIDMNVTGQIDMSGTLIEARRRVLPVRDQAQIPDAQVTDYIEVLPERTSDSESAAPVKPPNPFD